MTYENSEKLSARVLDVHRCIDSLREELEAVDLYNQRAELCSDEELKNILIHNADEEKEHAAMLIEWLRRNNKGFEKEIGEIVGASGSIAGHHHD
jgi:uncharacterized protein